MDPTEKKKKKFESGLDFDPFKPGAVGPDHDPMMIHLQKSIIASTISGARATLNEPSRPFTPADLPRHLFSGNDYSERPGSAYKIGQVAKDAIENFTRSSTAESLSSVTALPRANSRSRKNPILEPIVREDKKVDKKQKVVLKKNIPGDSSSVKPLNTFKGNKPIKAIKTIQHQTSIGIEVNKTSELSFNDWEIGRKQMQKNQESAVKQQLDLIESMQKAKQDYEDNIEEGEEDDMEKYFFDTINKDIATEINQPESYQQVMDKLEEIKRNQYLNPDNQQQEADEDVFDELDDDMEQMLMDDIHQSMQEEAEDDEESKYSEKKSDFEIEYFSLIEEFSVAINGDKRKSWPLDKVTELSNRVWGLIDEWRNQPSDTIKKWYKETMLKGILALIENKNPRAVFRLWKCCIHIIDSIYNQKIRLSQEQRLEDSEFIKVFNSLLSIIKILFKYSKGSENDNLFEEEKIYEHLLNVISNYYISGRAITDQLTMKVLKKAGGENVEIKNTNANFDMLIYIVGWLKNSSMTKQNQNILHNKNAIQILTKLCKTVLNEEEISNPKIPQLFVQITGCFRNLAMETQHIELFIQEGALVGLFQMMQNYKDHKELILNIVRILSKVSLNYEALDVMNLFGEEFIITLGEVLINSYETNSILIRAAFVIGNLTTVYSEARAALLKDARFFSQILDLSQKLFDKDFEKLSSSDKKIDFNKESTEDALTKIIRLIANLLTEEKCKVLLNINQKKIDKFFNSSFKSLENKDLKTSEECILNIVASFTNFLFYDTNDFSIFSKENAEIIRQNCIKRIGLYIFESDNEELKVETMRVMCNLSRNKEWWEIIVESETLLKALVDVLETTNRDILFYNIGLIINIGLNPVGRKKVTKFWLNRVILILKDSNIEDIDLSKVVWNALISFWEEKFLWSNADIQSTDDICSEIGEELDSIMDVANEKEKEILLQLRYLINQVINNLPEIKFDCRVENCGRKFKSNEELIEHMTRRHGVK